MENVKVSTAIAVIAKVTKTSINTEDTGMNLPPDPDLDQGHLKKTLTINHLPKNHTNSQGCSKTISNKDSEELLKKMSKVT